MKNSIASPSEPQSSLANNPDEYCNNTWVVNTFTLIAEKGVIEAEMTEIDLPRLTDSTAQGKMAPVQVSIRGCMARSGHSALHLQVQGSVNLICQRCLQEMPWSIQTNVFLDVVNDEKLLDTLDESEGAMSDAILGSTELDLCPIVEDELLLQLPYSPRHEHCSPPLAITPEDIPEPTEVVLENTTRPFADLSSMLRKKQGF